jgi:glycosyltransferase involved in cell wall biosynthesis
MNWRMKGRMDVSEASLEHDKGLPERVAFLLDNLNGGGAERVILDIAEGFSALGYDVDLLVCEARGVLLDSIPTSINLVVLNPTNQLSGLWAALGASGSGLSAILSCIASIRKIPRSFRFIPAIGEYLQRVRPSVLLSALPKSNIAAVLAQARAGVNTRVFVGAHISMLVRSQQGLETGRGQFHHMIPLLRHCYLRAAGVIAVSEGVAEDAVSFLQIDPHRVHVVYNPVTVREPVEEKNKPPSHRWFVPNAAPVVLGIGRLVAQKNFRLLVEAFARVRQHADIRLIILGGDESSAEQMAHRKELQELAAGLGVGSDVDLPGYQPNPHRYLRAARMFVLSSDYEGFGNVIVEALLAGCPVVSSDCPSGPAEILDNGRYGLLTPVNDVEQLAAAIVATLDTIPERQKLLERGLEFSLERAVEGYHRLFFDN